MKIRQTRQSLRISRQPTNSNLRPPNFTKKQNENVLPPLHALDNDPCSSDPRQRSPKRISNPSHALTNNTGKPLQKTTQPFSSTVTPPMPASMPQTHRPSAEKRCCCFFTKPRTTPACGTSFLPQLTGTGTRATMSPNRVLTGNLTQTTHPSAQANTWSFGTPADPLLNKAAAPMQASSSPAAARPSHAAQTPSIAPGCASSVQENPAAAPQKAVLQRLPDRAAVPDHRPDNSQGRQLQAFPKMQPKQRVAR